MLKKTAAHRVPPYRRPIIVGGFLLILAAVILITVLVCKNFFKLDDKQGQDNPKAPDTTQQPSDHQPERPEDQDLENKTPQYEGEDPNLLDKLTGVIVYKDIDSSNQVLHSAVTIDQYLHNDGQCVYNIKRDGAVLRTASAVAYPDVTTSVCGPFDLSLDGLSPGKYEIEVIMTGDGKRGILTEELQF